MKTLVIYYSFKGSTKKEAERIAQELGDADLCEVKESKKRNLFTSFVPGIFQAAGRKPTKIKPPELDFNLYNKIIIGAPIWASHPAPAWNSIVELLPEGKNFEVELFMVSQSGDSSASAQGSREIIEKKGCTVVGYRDVKTGES